MNDCLEKLRSHQHLNEEEIADVMHAIMSGSAAHDDIVDFLQLLRTKGPTVDEITGAAKILRQFSIPVGTKHKTILDTCGTGGDKKHTFNISTITAFVVAGEKVAVAKHGNRSMSSHCGSADVLENLGVKLTLDPQRLSECLDHVDIAFLFAQALHPAMKNVAAARKQLGVETIFNILGPLINPANATHQIIGVYRRELLEPIAQVLRNLGVKRGLVVHGADGLDEVTTTDITYVAEWNGKDVISYEIDPQELGLPLAREEDLKGGNLATNTQIMVDILQGQKGPKRDIVLLNAACAFYVVGKVSNIQDGMALAAVSIDSGKARAKLEALKNFTNA